MIATDRAAAPATESLKARLPILGLAMLAAMFDGFDGQMIGFVSPSIAAEWSLPKSQFGTIFALGLAGMVLGAVGIAPLGDRFGRRPVAIMGAILVAAFTLLTTFVSTPLELVLVRFATGVGLGTIMPILVTIAQEVAPQRLKGVFVTLLVSAFPFGSFVGGLGVASGLQQGSWRDIFLVAGLIAALFPLLFAWVLPGGRVLAPIDPDQLPAKVTIASLYRDGRSVGTVLLWLLFFASLLNTYMLGAWLPLLLERGGLGLADAVRAAAAFSLGGSIGGIVFGLLAVRFGGVILGAAYLAAAVALVLLGFATGLTWITVLTAAIGAAIAGGHVGNNVIAARMYPPFMNATGLGSAQGVGRVGCVVGPALVGAAIGQGLGNTAIFVGSAVFAVVGAAAALGLALRKA